jgi:hypothetical protein
MKSVQASIAVLCSLLVAVPPVSAQQVNTDRLPQIDPTRKPHWYNPITEPYRSRVVAPV